VEDYGGMKLIIAAVGCLLLLVEAGKVLPTSCVQFYQFIQAYLVVMTSTGNYVVEERRVKTGESWTNDQEWYYLGNKLKLDSGGWT